MSEKMTYILIGMALGYIVLPMVIPMALGLFNKGE